MIGLSGYRSAFLFGILLLAVHEFLTPLPSTRLPLSQLRTNNNAKTRTRTATPTTRIRIPAKKQAPRAKQRRRAKMASPPKKEEEREGEKGEAGRPRAFDVKARAECWKKADVVPGRHPERWRRDPAGNVVCKRFWNCHGCLCYEYDHIVPFSKGGESTADNCQILQTRVNRLKSNKEWIGKAELQGFSCDIKFTDKELDIIEMAVYGDVTRPGNQCRCRTVAEMLGKVKLKDKLAPCEIPYKESS
ncbi:hypothetical protein LUZ61_001542 [Rhynchospora tenuis]|uniref:HNH nuclease domain-containing protein n=1 Tax=Rhynchospora tenuis TaxID=198213 RepID=A0AAD5ZH55_9POAL|nr:hypothetical protein LUZ61_001542 [Rhynchospora tenuis]